MTESVFVASNFTRLSTTPSGFVVNGSARFVDEDDDDACDDDLGLATSIALKRFSLEASALSNARLSIVTDFFNVGCDDDDDDNFSRLSVGVSFVVKVRLSTANEGDDDDCCGDDDDGKGPCPVSTVRFRRQRVSTFRR